VWAGECLREAGGEVAEGKALRCGVDEFDEDDRIDLDAPPTPTAGCARLKRELNRLRKRRR